MHDLSLEFLHAFNIRPLEVVENTCSVEEQMAPVFEDPRASICWICLLEFDQPFASLLLPVASNDLSVEGHVFTKAPDFTDFVQVLPDVWRVGEEARPVGLKG